MKKIFIVLISIFLILCAAACGTVRPAEPGEVKSPSAPEQSAEPSVKISIYVSDENAEHFVEQSVMVNALDENSVFEALKAAGVVPEDAELLSFAQDNGAMALDLSDAYAAYIRTLGTSGEYMAIGGLVNTYIKNFGAQTVTLTVNGEPLESGHNIYDMPLEFFSDNAGA